jgi:hypothetical protein
MKDFRLQILDFRFWNIECNLCLARGIIRYLIFFSLFTLTFNLNAQISQPLRYEREHKNSDHEFIVISMNEKGIALVRDTEKYESSRKTWEVIFLDTTLQETWYTKIDVEQRMNILGHDYRNGNIYLIFQEPETAGRSIGLFEFHTDDKSVKQHLFKPEVNIHFTHFSVLKTKAIFGGYINKEPALLMYDLQDEKARVIPGVFQPNVDLLDVRVNSNDTFNTLLIEGRSAKNKKIVERTFDSNGVMIVDDEIVIEEGKTILEAITSSLIRDELIIAGTWTYGNSKQAAGIFSVVVDPFHDQKINYYDFAMFNHFLDGLKPKRAAKIKAKADWRRSNGKQIEYRSRLTPIRIEETKDGFSFLGEAYEVSTYNSRNASGYPTYYSPYNYYNPYGYYPYGFNSMPSRYYNPYNPYSTSPFSSSTEVRITDASLVFFDGHGQLTSDQSLHFPEIKLPSKEQVSDFILHNRITIMACKSEKEIVVKVAESEGMDSKEERIKPETKNSSETIHSEKEENTSIRTWYGRYFYIYGYHTLRDASKKTSRDVFYINKIKVN